MIITQAHFVSAWKILKFWLLSKAKCWIKFYIKIRWCRSVQSIPKYCSSSTHCRPTICLQCSTTFKILSFLNKIISDISHMLTYCTAYQHTYNPRFIILGTENHLIHSSSVIRDVWCISFLKHIDNSSHVRGALDFQSIPGLSRNFTGKKKQTPFLGNIFHTQLTRNAEGNQPF